MKITPKKVNLFMLLKLPLAYLGGVRVKTLSEEKATVNITHRWMNQNPFKSMFWAAQGMAAEMSTGILVMKAIEDSKVKVSMLVIHQEANFYKKATGKIVFTCAGGKQISEAIKRSKVTKEGQVVTLTAQGLNEGGVLVSKFSFEWSLKVKL
jgi:environmental stress-induced protein Ves